MGALFLLAGYFTPASFDRKGPGPFLRDRLVRLGIPLLAFYFVLGPLSFLGWWQMPASLTGLTEPLTWAGYWQMYPLFLDMGPMWFVALLLLFSIGYAGWRLLTRNRAPRPRGEGSLPRYLGIGVFVLGLALASYLLRIVIPVGQPVGDFPTLSYLPQYLSFFVVGAVASRSDWFRTVARSMGTVGLVAAGLATVTLFALAFLSLLAALERGAPQLPPFGYGTWQSAVYALWDSTFAVGLFVGMLVLFRRFFDGQGRLGRYLSQHSYTVYLIHIPVIVLIAVLLKGVGLAPLLKFGLVAVLAVPACFAVAYLVRKIPFASRVL
jgi:peptidoglycan/LPS O-acetylase OafA/YrhL